MYIGGGGVTTKNGTVRKQNLHHHQNGNGNNHKEQDICAIAHDVLDTAECFLTSCIKNIEHITTTAAATSTATTTTAAIPLVGNGLKTDNNFVENDVDTIHDPYSNLTSVGSLNKEMIKEYNFFKAKIYLIRSQVYRVQYQRNLINISNSKTVNNITMPEKYDLSLLNLHQEREKVLQSGLQITEIYSSTLKQFQILQFDIQKELYKVVDREEDEQEEQEEDDEKKEGKQNDDEKKKSISISESDIETIRAAFAHASLKGDKICNSESDITRMTSFIEPSLRLNKEEIEELVQQIRQQRRKKLKSLQHSKHVGGSTSSTISTISNQGDHGDQGENKQVELVEFDDDYITLDEFTTWWMEQE